MRKPTISKRGLRLVGLIASLAIAAYGQHIIDDRGSLGAGWPLLASFDSKLTTIYQAPQSVAFAIPLFVIAALFFVVSIRALLGRRDTEPADSAVEPPRPTWPHRKRWSAAAACLGVLSFGGWSYLSALGYRPPVPGAIVSPGGSDQSN